MKQIKLKDGSILELNRGYKMDCLDLMRQLPDNCIDLVLTDPPYGIGIDKKHSKNKKQSKKSAVKSTGFKNKNWDKFIPSEELFNEIFRVSKNQIIWGVNYFNHEKLKGGRIYWDKCVTMPTYSDGEIAFCSCLNSVKYFKHAWHGMIQENMKNKEDRIHPTQKPLKLFKWCLEKYAIPIIEKQNIDPKDFIVADFFGGSFTTGCASHDYGFSWFITETDDDYFRDGTKRVKDYQKQGLLQF